MLIVAIAIVLALWLGQALLFGGIGALYLRLAADPAARLGLPVAAFVGYAVAVVLLQLWHFAAPLNGLALGALGAVSVAGWIVGGRVVLPTAGAMRAAVGWTGLIGAALLLWAADRSVGPNLCYDSGNYHLATVRWYEALPIVPGLGNVAVHFGFNNGTLLFPATLEVGWLRGRTSHFANSFLLALVLVELARRAFQFSGDRTRAPAAALVLLSPALYFLLADNQFGVASLSTDTGPALAALLGWVLLLSAADSTEARRSAPAVRLAASAALFAVLPWMKPSFLVLSLLTLPLFALQTEKGSRAPRWLRAALMLAVVGGLSWVARNVLTTGYPLFPSSAFPFPVDWRVPVEYADGVAWFIRAYARAPDDVAATGEGLGWVSDWIFIELRKAKFELLFPLWGGVVALALSLWRARGERVRLLLGLAPLLLALGSWLSTAPGFRFGLPLCWLLFAHTFAELSVRHRFSRLGWSSVAVVLLVAPVGWKLWLSWRSGEPPPGGAGLLVTRPGPDFGFYPLHQPKLIPRTLASGLILPVPAAGSDAAWPDRVPWNCEVPCAPPKEILAGLRMRKPGQLASGFAVPELGPRWPAVNRDVVHELAQQGRSVREASDELGVAPLLVREALLLPAP